MVVANVIGAGIFTTSGFIARDLADPVALLAVWVVGGVLALAGALSYSELGAAMPEAGGEYVYLRETYGPLVGFLSGWVSFFIGFSGAIAAVSLAFAHYLRTFPRRGTAARGRHPVGHPAWSGRWPRSTRWA